ncbi:hypothetical protein BOTBODRAFT_171262 [Botryobasidium botryosum FD-172 SS1]|uniref:CCHC-type domain-containing protein n=1 Tax=Botryobasidium botryosum (strain FD-172 SS1) TaxID=930990 RepID=A0A067MUQ0_BOTB1|nr:hypothetical protein BOTBODRAFT_171262 [Botryobasidium botryosum FD-172 SS1]
MTGISTPTTPANTTWPCTTPPTPEKLDIGQDDSDQSPTFYVTRQFRRHSLAGERVGSLTILREEEDKVERAVIPPKSRLERELESTFTDSFTRPRIPRTEAQRKREARAGTREDRRGSREGHEAGENGEELPAYHVSGGHIYEGDLGQGSDRLNDESPPWSTPYELSGARPAPTPLSTPAQSTPRPLPTTPATPQQPPPPPPQLTPTTMALGLGDVEALHGDGRASEVPLDWLKRLALLTPGLSEQQRIEAVGFGIASGSAAEEWWENEVTAADKVSWTTVRDAFRRKWPLVARLQLTAQQRSGRLLEQRLAEEDLGKTELDSVMGVEVGKHVKWAARIRDLGEAVDTGGLLIRSVVEKTPPTLQALLTGTYTTWTELHDAIANILTATLLERRKSEQKMVAMEAQLQQLMTQLSLQQQGGRTTAPSGSGAYRLKSTPYAPSGLITTSSLVDREPCLEYRKGPFPVTPAGAAEYQEAIAAYARKFGDARPAPANPYPLSPGTSPLGSGECYRCGKAEPHHTQSECRAPAQIPSLEREWRRHPMHRRGQRPFGQGTGVGAVFTTGWEELLTWAEYYAEEGKEEESPK